MMPTFMTQLDPFELEVDGGIVSGTLATPDAPGASVHPAVLICRGLHTFDNETAALFRDLGATLVDAGVAVVEFEPRSAKMILEDFHAYTAPQNIDDAAAVLDWLRVCDRVDPLAIGVLGYDLGAVTAACLGRRSEQIAAIALLAPAGPGAASTADDAEPLYGPDEMPAGYAASLQTLDPFQDAAFHDRPTLIVSAAADREMPAETALAYRSALELANRPVEHVQVALADHLFSTEDARAACLDRIERFFVGIAAATTSAARK